MRPVMQFGFARPADGAVEDQIGARSVVEGLLPGATAYTVTGTRHRTGVWEGQGVTDARPVSFTIFAACPDDEDCRLLRLSALDTPLR